MNTANLQTKNSTFLKVLVNSLSIEKQDEIYLATGVSWNEYLEIIQQFTDSSHYKISYLEETLQIMSPGRNHEIIKEYISGLLEAYFQELEIDYYPLGSTTFRNLKRQAGKEPDCCYCLETNKEFPDLAIEVIFSSGGIDILEIYQRLQIKEVWLWQNKQLKIYCLDNNQYTQVTSSQILPDLDIQLLIKYISKSNIRLAIKEFRQELKK